MHLQIFIYIKIWGLRSCTS